MSTVNPEIYTMSALLIHSADQEVTIEKMASIFKHLNLSIDEKLAEKFVLPKYTYENLCTISAGSGEGSAETVQEEVKEEVKEEESAEVDLDDFF